MQYPFRGCFMVNPVQPNSQMQNAQLNGVEVRRIPRGVGDDRGSVQPPKRPGLCERGVHWFCFFLVGIVQKIFKFFSPAAPEPPALPAPPAPAPEPVDEPREDDQDPFEGTPLEPHALLQYCYYIQSSNQPPVNDPNLYLAYERLAEVWEKKWTYHALGKANRWTPWEWLTCRSEEAKLARDVRAGKEYAKKTPSVLINYVTPLLEKYCKEHPQPPEQ